MPDICQETSHHMGRRLHGWDYSTRAIYMVTMNLAERGRPVLAGWPVTLASAGKPKFGCPPTPAGSIVEQCWLEIPTQWPGVEVLCHQVMPDHFHGILFVKAPLPKGKTLGNIIGSFKSRSASRVLAARGEAQNSMESRASPRAAKFWEEGYVDTILFRKGQLASMSAYIRDNPDRLAEKRANPEMFRQVGDLAVHLPAGWLAQAAVLHFQALGNRALLDWPVIEPVQCSRSFFAYRRERLASGAWRILRDAVGVPLVEKTTPEFEALVAKVLDRTAQGAVLISPCLSHGERELVRRTHAIGACVIVLRNKGFAQYEKPAGPLFDLCAQGRLLLLAPAAWPHLPGEKPPTRESALVLNRIAQLIAARAETQAGGESRALPPAAEYMGAQMPDIDTKVQQACKAH